ncbi:MAG: metallophosphoesterase [Anaerolineales bacterium]
MAQQNNVQNTLNRRSFLKFSGAALFAGLSATMAYLYMGNEVNEPVIENIDIPIRGLPSALEGFRIVQISDIHYYPFTKLELVDRAVKMANELQPDLVLLTGDYVWHEVEHIFDLMPSIARLTARYGVFANLGNHDLWTDVNVITLAFKEIGMPLLVNQGLTIPVGSDHLYLAGLDDGWSGKPDLSAAMQDWPDGAPTVLLMHEPDLADRYSQDSRINLQLSGHSHGGQIRFPLMGALIYPYLSWKYPIGLYNINGMWLYTNRGLGTTNIPLRVNCAPEITELTLVSA